MSQSPPPSLRPSLALLGEAATATAADKVLSLSCSQSGQAGLTIQTTGTGCTNDLFFFGMHGAVTEFIHSFHCMSSSFIE